MKRTKALAQGLAVAVMLGVGAAVMGLLVRVFTYAAGL